MQYYRQNEWTEFHLHKMGLRIKNGDPLQSIILNDRPDEDIQHIHWRILGEEVFRAKIAILLLEYYPGNGKILQQSLGNIFSNRKKQEYFDKYHFFSKTIIHDNSVDVALYKHHIVNAFLGFLVEYLTEEELNTYILKYWMNDVWGENDVPNWKRLKLYAKSKGLDIEKKIINNDNNSIKAVIVNKTNNNIIIELTGTSPKYILKKLIQKGYRAIKNIE